jgi:hypothetical protein
VILLLVIARVRLPPRGKDTLVIDRGSYFVGRRALDEGGATCFEVTACDGVCAGNAVRGGVPALIRVSEVDR